MLEFIGFLAVVWIVWAMVKVFFRNAVKATVAHSVDDAVQRGVPREFARAVVDNPELLTTLRAQRAQTDKEFAAQDAHVQYAQTIKDVHSASKAESKIREQVAALEAQGIDPVVSEYTFAYVAALVLIAIGPGGSLETIKGFIERGFADLKYRPMIESAYQVAQGSPDFFEKAGRLFPAAQSDFLGQEATYLVRLTKRSHEYMLEQAASGDWDPRTAPAFDYVNV